VIERMAAAMKEILELPAVRGRLVEMGSEPLFMDPAETDRFVRAEYDRWGPVVRAANIKAE
jgi:tripartite-type tricarboxylate transporter receptor subunit TctC